MAQLFETWKWKSHGGYKNSNFWVMSIFSNRKHGAMVYGKPVKLMEILSWWILWHNALGRQVCRLIHLVAWCATWCALSPGVLRDARAASKSLGLLNNLKHCHHWVIESIVHSCIALFKINMHELYIFLLILFLIYLIQFLIKRPLIYLINIIIMIFFSNCFGLCLLFVTLKRLITAHNFCGNN